MDITSVIQAGKAILKTKKTKAEQNKREKRQWQNDNSSKKKRKKAMANCQQQKGKKGEEAKTRRPQRDSNPQSSDPKSDALSVGPCGLAHSSSSKAITQVRTTLNKRV